MQKNFVFIGYTVSKISQENQNPWNNKSLKKDSRLKTLKNLIFNHETEIEKDQKPLRNAENECSNKNSSVFLL